MTFPLDLSLFSKAAAMQILLFSTPLGDGPAGGSFPGVDISRPQHEASDRLPRTLRRPRKKCRVRSISAKQGCQTARIASLKGARIITGEQFSLVELPESDVIFELN
jgi:hypothetical protein